MKCPVCKSQKMQNKYKDVEGFRIKKTFNIEECLNCGVYITSPTLSKSEYSNYHNKHQVAFNGTGDEESIANYLQNKKQQWVNFGYEKRLDRIVSVKPNAKKIMDIGCGAGFYLDFLKNRGFTVEGIELAPWGYNIAKEKLGLKVQNNLIENLKPPKNKFEVITLYDVIEHTTEPNAFLQELKKWLKKDGVLIINVPNIDSNISKHADKYWNKLSPPDHTLHFNEKSISYLLNKNGFYPFSISTNSGNPGESLSQITLAFWIYLSKYSKKINNALSKMNKPYSKNRDKYVAAIKASRVISSKLGFIAMPIIRGYDKSKKGEGLNVVCRQYE